MLIFGGIRDKIFNLIFILMKRVLREKIYFLFSMISKKNNKHQFFFFRRACIFEKRETQGLFAFGVEFYNCQNILMSRFRKGKWGGIATF